MPKSPPIPRPTIFSSDRIFFFPDGDNTLAPDDDFFKKLGVGICRGLVLLKPRVSFPAP